MSISDCHLLTFLFSPESPTVMLAAGSFSSPYEHLSQPETKRMVEHYTAYLSDNTRLIANPGLKVCKHTHQCCNKYFCVTKQKLLIMSCEKIP